MKNKVMGLLALASCVMLSGCGEPPVEVKIVIADLPTDLVAGNKIDLKDYITVSGGNGGYSINFDDESFAKITQETDTEITLNEFGTVNFTVDYSGKTKEGSINVGSLLLNNFVKEVSSAGYNYTTITYDENWYMDSMSNFGERFYVNMWFEQVSDTEYLPGGYLKADDDRIYSFTIDDEMDLDFSITGGEPDDISEFSKPMPLPVSGYEVGVEESGGEKVEVLSLKENDEGIVASLFESLFWINPDYLKEYSLVPSGIEILQQDLPMDEETSIPAYDLYAKVVDNDPTSQYYGQEDYLTVMTISMSEDLLELKELVEEYIKEPVKPVTKYELNVDKISSAINNHNYTITYDYGWYKASINSDGTALVRGEKLESNPFCPDLEKVGDYIRTFLNATGDFKVYVGENKTFSDVPHEDGYGLVNKAGEPVEAYKYSGNSTDGYKAKSESTGFELYDPENNSIYQNYQFLTGAEIDGYPSVYDELFINKRTKNKSGDEFSYSLAGSTAGDLFDCLFLEPIFDGDYPVIDPEDQESWIVGKFNTLNIVAQFMLDEGMYKYFEVEIVEKYSGDALVGLVFDFAWIDALEDEFDASKDQYFQYVFNASIDFTECAMPSFDVQF